MRLLNKLRMGWGGGWGVGLAHWDVGKGWFVGAIIVLEME